MLFRGIVKKYTAYLILLTKVKKIIGMKSEKVVQYEGTSFNNGIFTPKPRDPWWFFV